MKNLLLVVSVVITIMIGLKPTHAAGPEALSVWQNQSGSIFSIDTFDPSSFMFTGTYVNNKAGTGCQGTSYNLTGYILNNFMTWSVAWSNSYATCNSVTGWTGYYANGEITTDWNLAYQGSDGPAIMQGSDVFTNIGQTTSDALVN